MTSREELLRLGHQIGEPAREWALMAEGNISARVDDTVMLVKASGCSMRTMVDDDLLTVDRRRVLSLLDVADVTDDVTAQAYRDCVVDSGPGGRMPSVEAILHAVIYEETDAAVVAHTHPTAVNAILCSQSAQLIVAGSLFPDQIVVLGRRQLLVPYTDPGVPLAAAVRAELRAFSAANGVAPRAVYLQNHGLFALAGSPDEALQVTSMAVKVAQILLGAITAGGPVFLSDEHVDRIDRRPDEHYRRARLAHDSGRN
jgi:rhamnose utilization protein RhaD (predicted bifunctional aldolase and dehydrogenase)